MTVRQDGSLFDLKFDVDFTGTVLRLTGADVTAAAAGRPGRLSIPPAGSLTSPGTARKIPPVPGRWRDDKTGVPRERRMQKTANDCEQDFTKRSDFGNFQANVRFVEETGVLAKTARILEVGSGNGRLLEHYHERGFDIVGVEINPQGIEEIRARNPALRVFPVDSALLPFADGAFDVVLSFDVFEHLPDTKLHLAQVRRVLRPGGYYLFQTPNKLTNVVFETIRWRSFTKWKREHCSLHGYRQIRKVLRESGFSPVFHDIPVLTEFFREKVRFYLGRPGVLLVKLLNPDSWPLPLRTNFFIAARRRQ